MNETTITVTADAGNGELAYFKLKPLKTMALLIDAIGWISDVQDVLDLAEEGEFEIV